MCVLVFFCELQCERSSKEKENHITNEIKPIKGNNIQENIKKTSEKFLMNPFVTFPINNLNFNAFFRDEI